ncbi:MAG: hypothetical protein Q4D67_05525 [Streptococcus minor]|nr:hypothetical protein [Streptococcus minor]
MKNYLQQVTYASLVWAVAFLMNFGVELFQVYNETHITLMGLQIQNIDNKETLTNFFSLTPRFYLIYFGVIFVWLSLYHLTRRGKVAD